MNDLFITDIHINKVRHLENIDILISKDKRKNLIITGKNGTGKTSLLECLRDYCFIYFDGKLLAEKEKSLNGDAHLMILRKMMPDSEKKRFKSYGWNCGNLKNLKCEFKNDSLIFINQKENKLAVKKFILKYFSAKRNQQYEIDSKPKIVENFRGEFFHTYIVNMKNQALIEKGLGIDETDSKEWFDKFEERLRNLYKDTTLKLEYHYKEYLFTIKQDGKESFGFNELADGYASIIDIISEIIMYMEESKQRDYNMQGIVMIDEIETHLHLDLQKNILPFLSELFPNIQFIVTTHSPFVITSDPNAIVFDLETKKRVEDMTKYSYKGAVDGYFEVNNISLELNKNFERYKELVEKKEKSNSEIAEIENLERKLDEVPDFLNLDFASEYIAVKLKKEYS